MFRIVNQPICTESLREQVLDPASGGFVSFEGWVRNHHEGKEVKALEYESYELLANQEGARILKEAVEKFDLKSAVCEHRVGYLEIGGMAVCVMVSAAHREEAFTACSYIIDEVKARVPVWKKEYYLDGPSEWVGCHRCAEKGHRH